MKKTLIAALICCSGIAAAEQVFKIENLKECVKLKTALNSDGDEAWVLGQYVYIRSTRYIQVNCDYRGGYWGSHTVTVNTLQELEEKYRAELAVRKEAASRQEQQRKVLLQSYGLNKE